MTKILKYIIILISLVGFSATCYAMVTQYDILGWFILLGFTSCFIIAIKF